MIEKSNGAAGMAPNKMPKIEHGSNYTDRVRAGRKHLKIVSPTASDTKK